MAVEDVGRKTQPLHGLQRGFGEEAEPLAVIRIVAGRRAVERVPIEGLVVLDEIDPEAVRAMLPEREDKLAAAHGDPDTVQGLRQGQPLFPDLPV